MSEESEAACTARILVEELVAAGVREVCVSPGSRSTPLTLACVAHSGLQVSSHIDERAGSFYALGLAKVSGRPVALVCTSGSAVANYLPAVVEASLSRVPLVVLSADRPPELHDCGANQTIDQEGLFGSYVRFAATIAAARPAGSTEAALRRLADRAIAAASGSHPGPVHLNCQFREPFAPRLDDRPTNDVDAGQPLAHTRTFPPSTTAVPELPDEVADLLAASQRPLLVMGPRVSGGLDEQNRFRQLAERLGAAVFAEVPANLSCLDAAAGRVDAYDALLRSGQPGTGPDLIVRSGGVPTSKALGQFLAQCHGVPQVVLAEAGEWPDPGANATYLISGPLRALLTAMLDHLPESGQRSAWAQGWVEAGTEARRRLDRYLDQACSVEGGVLRDVAHVLGTEDALFVGNSLAVRDLDLFCSSSSCEAAVFVNRGASGIDGLVSTVFGIAAGHAGATVGVLGDVSFLHDAGGLLAATRTPAQAVLVVLDNDGGGIFDHLPLASEEHPAFEDFFITSHGRSIEALSRAWGVEATEVSARDFPDSLRKALGGDRSHVLVVRIDRAESRKAHREAIELLAQVPGWN